jgi:hypothetical protein
VPLSEETNETKKVNYMSKNSVLCIATSRNQANRIVDHLKTESFSNRDISVLFPDTYDTRNSAHEKNIKAPGAAAEGPGVGGVLGWVAEIGPLAIPGVGPFIAAGPVVAALTGVVFSATVGTISRGLVALGLSEPEATRYEDKVKEGNILLSVHTDDVGDIARVRDIFEQAGAECISTTASARKNNKTRFANQAPPVAEPAPSAS